MGRASTRFIKNTATKMEACREKEFIRRQIAIFREVDRDIATRLEKALGVKGHDDIRKMRFNGTHNGMTSDPKLRYANGVSTAKGSSVAENNGAPGRGTHKEVIDGNGSNGGAAAA
jgi:catalase